LSALLASFFPSQPLGRWLAHHVPCSTFEKKVESSSRLRPSFYGEEAIPGVYSNVKRDEYEAGVYGEALALKKAMVGICRGSQFLNVMNGGKLWQDVNNHGRGHAVTDIKTGEIIQGMTSTHHQQMRPAEDAEIIAVAELSTTKKAEGDTVIRGKPELDDMEVLWYPSENAQTLSSWSFTP